MDPNCAGELIGLEAIEIGILSSGRVSYHAEFTKSD